MRIKLDLVWIGERTDNEKELRLDWSNARHHAVVIQHPGGAQEVAEAFQLMAELVLQDKHLREPPQAKEKKE